MRQDSATQNGPDQILKSEGTQAGGSLAARYGHGRKDTLHHTKSADYSELEMQSHMFNNNMMMQQGGRRSNKSKSTDDMRLENNAVHLQHRPPSGMMMHPSMTMAVPPQPQHMHPDHTMKRVFKPMSSIDSPVTSPEMTRKRHSHHYHYHPSNNNQQKYVMSEVENDNYVHAYNVRHPYPTRFQQTRNVHSMEIDRQYSGIAGRRVSYSSSLILFYLF